MNATPNPFGLDEAIKVCRLVAALVLCQVEHQ